MNDLPEIESIKRLKHKYLRCLDTKTWEDMAECFAEDAETSYAGGKFSFKGRDAIVEFLKEALPHTLLTMHQGFHPEIELTGENSAEGSWGFMDYLIDTKNNISLRGYGYYQDTYVRVNGEWKIKSTGYKRVFEESWNRADTPSNNVTENMFNPPAE